MNHGEVGYSLYVLKDGRYHLFAGQKEVPWRRECRIDVAGETVEAMYKDHWGKYGDLRVKMPLGATSADGGGIGISGGENGKPLSITINADTEGEKVTGHDFEPVGDSLSNAKFIGTFHAPSDDPQLIRRKRERN